MDLIPGMSTDDILEAVVKKKLQPYLDKAYQDAAEQEAYVKEYIENAGDDFKEAITSQIDQLTSDFQDVVQETIKMGSALAATAGVLANPMTAAAGNQMIITLVGESKSVIEKIGKISSYIMDWIGIASSTLAVLEASAKSTQDSASDSITLVEEEFPETYIPSGEAAEIDWVWVDPCTGLSVQFDGYSSGSYPVGITVSVDETSKTLEIACDVSLAAGEYDYTVSGEYEVADGMDNDGNVEYSTSEKSYQAKIVKA